MMERVTPQLLSSVGLTLYICKGPTKIVFKVYPFTNFLHEDEKCTDAGPVVRQGLILHHHNCLTKQHLQPPLQYHPSTFPRAALRLCPFCPTFLKGSLVDSAPRRRGRGALSTLGGIGDTTIIFGGVGQFWRCVSTSKPVGNAPHRSSPLLLPPLLHIPPLRFTVASARSGRRRRSFGFGFRGRRPRNHPIQSIRDTVFIDPRRRRQRRGRQRTHPVAPHPPRSWCERPRPR